MKRKHNQFSIFESEEVPSDSKWTVPETLPDLTHIDCLSLDTETESLHFRKSKPVGISIAYREYNEIKSWYLPFGHSAGNMDPDRVREWANNELAFKHIYFCNGKFDIHQLKNFGVDLEGACAQPDDVQFRAALLDDSRHLSVKLSALAVKYTDMKKLEIDGADINNMAGLPSWEVGAYAERDAVVTLKIAEATDPLIREENLESVLELENNLIYPVCEIERNGCRIDRANLEKMKIRAAQDFRRIIMEIHRLTGFGLNPTAPKSMEELFILLKIRVPKETRKGKDGNEREVSTFTAARLRDAKHPIIDMALKARQLDSLRSRYLAPFSEHLESNGNLFYALHQLRNNDRGTVAGRFSSSGGDDPRNGYYFNVQQIKKVKDDSDPVDFEAEDDDEIAALSAEYPIRSIFIPDEGSIFSAHDARQIEYRLFAHFAKSKSVLDSYKKDPLMNYHKFVWAMLKEAGSLIGYQQTKNSNFARLYGAGIKKIAKMTGLSESETKAFLALYDRVLPEGKAFMDETSRVAGSQGYITTLGGRRARFKEHGEPLHKAVNRLIQGTAADIFKMKLLRVYNERNTLGITKLRQPVHDEQCADLDPDPKYRALMQECFDTQEINLRCPLLWEGGYGNTWIDAH